MIESVQLIQFAKWPERGRVKTRLEPALGQQGALAAHVRLTLTVLEHLVASGHPLSLAWDRDLDCPPDEALPVLRRLEALAVGQRTQQGRDLGERMTRALDDALSTTAMAMVVGSDCPSVDADYIQQAAAALADADVVFGPSDDGGYVLIGARRVHPRMLNGVAWGSEMALEQSLEAVRKAGLRSVVLSPRWDVDEPGDWTRFVEAFG